MKGTPLRFLFAVLTILPGCSKSTNRPQATTAGSPTFGKHAPSISCSSDTALGVRISRHCIGPIPVDSPLAAIAARFPGYQAETTYLETSPIPGWRFSIGGVTATAAMMDRPTAPAWSWMVSGNKALLDPGVPLPSTWGELTSHYTGRAIVNVDELGPHAQLCELPGLTFFLDFPYRPRDADTMPVGDVPSTARVLQVGIYPAEPDTVCH